MIQKIIKKPRKYKCIILPTLLILIIIGVVIIIVISVKSSNSSSNNENNEYNNNNDNYDNIIKAIFYTEDSNLIKIINNPFDKLNIKLFIDGKEIDFVTEYQFQTSGNHSVIFKFKEELTNLSSLFSGCEQLKEIDFSGVNKNNIKIMNNLFDGCTSLENLDLDNLNTSNLENMDSLFQGCLVYNI